ncbi:TonB-dependent receptor [Nibrella saemangeumensis]|uniref:TonB-dependent receptor n=1 Tax=Nibrella saemangeumensis TaxID=1084526 RepID=A0ABP8MB69_9BACT
MRFLLFLVCLFSLTYSTIAQPSTSGSVYSLTGYVRESVTQQPIQGVTIFISDSRRGVTTGKDGYFIISVPAGTYTVRFSHVGFKPVALPITIREHTYRDVLLEDDTKSLEEVTVTTEAPDRNVRKVEIGVSQMSIRNIKRIPAFMGEVDVVRSLLLLPGVSTVGEGAPGLNIRGGSTDQNLVLMDDAPIFNASHLMGFFSVFNPDAVRDVTLHRGGVAPAYGGRASSVLDIKVREPDNQKWSVSGGVGLVSSRLGVEGPLIKNKLSILAASRLAINDFLFKIGPTNLRDTRANFYDVTTKLKYLLDEHHTLTFTGYIGKDVFKLASDSLATVEVNASSTRYDYRTLNGTLRWNYFINDRFNLATTAVVSHYASTNSSPDSANAFRLESEIQQRQLKTDLSFLVNEAHSVQGGVSVIDYRIQPNQLIPGTSSNVLPVILPLEQAYELAAYIQDEWTVNANFSVLAGLRYSELLTQGPATVRTYQEGIPKEDETVASVKTYSAGTIFHRAGGFEPRLALRFTLAEGQSIKAGYNRLRQYIHQITNTTAALPTARWALSNPYIQPQIADQWSLGYFRNTATNMYELSAEVYYKLIQNAIDYKDGAQLLLTRFPETELLQGQGKAYGLETMVRKNKGFWTGWASYTYARTFLTIDGPYLEERVNNGNVYPANFDKPHTVNIAAVYRPSARFNVSLNFTYSTGRPITQPYARARVNGVVVPIYIDRNQQRIPDYHRLDFSMQFEQDPAKKKRWQSSWVFSVYNVYARKNAYSVFYKLNSRSFTDASKLAIFGTAFPSLTYNFKF